MGYLKSVYEGKECVAVLCGVFFAIVSVSLEAYWH